MPFLSFLEPTFLQYEADSFLPTLILLFLAKVRLSLTLTLSLTAYYLVIRIDGSVPLSFGKDGSCFLDNSSIWTDGSFPFGKGGSGVFANCLIWGAETTLLFRICAVCSSFSAKACAILQVLHWSRQHQQVCGFSSFLFLSYSRCLLATLSIFYYLNLWHIWQELSSLSSFTIRL